MKVLLAGGTGHTGERLARRLIRAGHSVMVLSRRSPDEPILAALIQSGASHAKGECGTREAFAAALAGCDALISCAHVKHAPGCVSACADAGVARYIQMSSARLFSQVADQTVEQVKHGETAITASNLDYTILRPTMIFGGRRDANLTRLVAWFRRHRWLPMIGDGAALVQPVYTEDVVTAIAQALEHPGRATRRAFNIGGPDALTWRAMMEEIALAVRGTHPLFIPVPRGAALAAASVLPRRIVSREQILRISEDKSVDIAEARAALGFAPVPFRDAIRLKESGKAEVEALYSR